VGGIRKTDERGLTAHARTPKKKILSEKHLHNGKRRAVYSGRGVCGGEGESRLQGETEWVHGAGEDCNL